MKNGKPNPNVNLKVYSNGEPNLNPVRFTGAKPLTQGAGARHTETQTRAGARMR